MTPLPEWAEEMRRLFRSGSTSQFILFGNVHDLVASPRGETTTYQALRHFLTEMMFEPFDVVVHYDRGRGIRVRKGGEHFHRFLQAYDAFRGTTWAKVDVGDDSLDLSGTLPRDAPRALELLNRFLRGSQMLTRTDGGPA